VQGGEVILQFEDHSSKRSANALLAAANWRRNHRGEGGVLELAIVRASLRFG
jgi:hypothetical protein